MSKKNIAKILSKIHQVQKQEGSILLHGNLDKSNFFVGEDGKLGIFDFVGMIYGEKEYDLAILYFNSGYDDLFFNELLENYIYGDDVDYGLLYKYTIVKIIENIKYISDISHETRLKLRKDIVYMKSKINSL